jgi:hypothetical protein
MGRYRACEKIKLWCYNNCEILIAAVLIKWHCFMYLHYVLYVSFNYRMEIIFPSCFLLVFSKSLYGRNMHYHHNFLYFCSCSVNSCSRKGRVIEEVEKSGDRSRSRSPRARWNLISFLCNTFGVHRHCLKYAILDILIVLMALSTTCFWTFTIFVR